MALQGGKSSRVLTRGSLSKVDSVKPPERVLKGKQKEVKSKGRKLVGHPVDDQPKPKAKSKVLKRPHPLVEKKPPAKRTISRLPACQEENIGKRARMNRLTVLEERSISAEIQNQYSKYYQQFMSFCLANRVV